MNLYLCMYHWVMYGHHSDTRFILVWADSPHQAGEKLEAELVNPGGRLVINEINEAIK